MDGKGGVGEADLELLLTAWGTNPGGPPDFDGDGVVAVPDLLTLLAAPGPAEGCQLADFDLDGIVGVPDLLTLLANWG